jgi:beta-lactam-binding protein with PASTA domain
LQGGVSKRRRRWEKRGIPRWANRRLLLQIVGVGLVAFLLGYAAMALLFFPGSSGDHIVTVPDLRGEMRTEAERQAARAGLEIEIGDSLAHPRAPVGSVLAQTPLPGQEVAPGSMIRLILSMGPARRPVPDVLAMTREQAVRILSGSGFEVRVEEVTNERAAGQVVNLRPAPGTPVALPSTIVLTVSSGPPLVEVPLLLGLREPEAREALEAAGLKMGDVEYDYRGWEARGDVVAQDPLARDSVPEGSPVRLTVGDDLLRLFPRGEDRRPR